jgi:hypothetical protein
MRIGQSRAILEGSILVFNFEAASGDAQGEDHRVLDKRNISGYLSIPSGRIVARGGKAVIETINGSRGIQIGSVKVSSAKETKPGTADSLVSIILV